MAKDIVSDVTLEALREATMLSANLVKFSMSPNTLEKDVVNGILPKDTPAVIYIYSDYTPMYQTSKFILSSMTRQHSEKFQLVETFTTPSLFFFGEKVKIYSIQGFVLDAESDQEASYEYEWAAQLQHFYETYLSGTKLAEQGYHAVLKTNGLAISGYPIQLSFSKSSEMENYQQFNMTWLVSSDVPEDLLVSTDTLNYDAPGAAQAGLLAAYLGVLRNGDRTEIANFFKLLSKGNS